MLAYGQVANAREAVPSIVGVDARRLEKESHVVDVVEHK